MKGWRLWGLSKDMTRLVPYMYWNKDASAYQRGMFEAECRRLAFESTPVVNTRNKNCPKAIVPNRLCSCGIYAFNSIAQINRNRTTFVIAMVSGYGKIIKHEFGWRARYVMPESMYLVFRSSVNKRIASELASYYDVDVVPIRTYWDVMNSHFVKNKEM